MASEVFNSQDQDKAPLTTTKPASNHPNTIHPDVFFLTKPEN
jgi:hypothetical protein